MITNADRLAQAQEQVERMERALAALRDEVLPVNPRLFRLMAEEYVEQIRQLRAQIDELTGLALAEAEPGFDGAKGEAKGVAWADASVAETEGDLRALDLDNRSFILRNANPGLEIRCEFTEELAPTVTQALGRRVRVRGVRRRAGDPRASLAVKVTALEIL